MNSFRLKSYLTFLSRNKLFTFINLFGFAVSLAVVILLGLYLGNETSVDKFHKDHERLWRLTNESHPGFPAPIAADIKNRYPEIEAVTRVAQKGRVDFLVDKDREKILASTLCADSTFFDIFSFPILEGDPSGQLRTKQEITLTKSFATKMFGDTPAVGKTLLAYNHGDTINCIVTGVVADLRNTHFANPDIIARFEHVGEWYLDSYSSCNWMIYLRTVPGSDLQSKMPDLAEHFKTYFWIFQKGVSKELHLQPVTDCYFDSNSYGTQRRNSRDFLDILGLTMVVILLFAVINYVNLSVAQSGFRAKEAATRRLLGSSHGGLFAGFITESVVFCIAAAALAVILAVLAEPAFNKLMETDMSVAGALTAGNILLALVAAALLGAVSGIMPSLAVARHKPIEVVRGTFARETRMVYSRVLIVFQYCITIILLGCTFTIMRQTNFMRTAELGFRKENIIRMDNTVSTSKLPGLHDRLMRVGGVDAVSFCAGDPTDGGNNWTVTYPDRESVSFQMFNVDSAFMDMLGIKIISRTGIADRDAFYLNETAMKSLDLPDTATSFNFYNPAKLAGVVKDFHFRDLSEKVGPAIITLFHDGYKNKYEDSAEAILVKISGPDQARVYDEVKAAYLEYNGGVPFESGFLDSTINSWYDGQQRIYTIIGSFSVIAILIAALGMLAMAAYYLRQRTAEIAIRKVFGSTNGEVLRKVIFNFLRMVLIAFVIAVPVIGYVMERWLSAYAYRISLGWTIFALAGLVALAVAFATVFRQTYKATSANPVDSLHR